MMMCVFDRGPMLSLGTHWPAVYFSMEQTCWRRCSFVDRGPTKLRGAPACSIALHGAGPLAMRCFLIVAPCCLSRAGLQSTFPWSRPACDDVILIVGPRCLSGCTSLRSTSPWIRPARDGACLIVAPCCLSRSTDWRSTFPRGWLDVIIFDGRPVLF